MVKQYMSRNMKAIQYKFILLLSILCLSTIGCSEKGSKKESQEKRINAKGDTVLVSMPDSMEIYRKIDKKENCFIVISKKYLCLQVYEVVKNDTLLTAFFPVCLSRNKGEKQSSGDMRTPESTMEEPFSIEDIQDASTWTHDFGDGRGAILAYGNWFLRLSTGFRGIGIHGSTGNEDSVPGRDSEGCIRLRDADIIYLKENYAFVGMKVTIQHEDEEPYSFERQNK